MTREQLEERLREFPGVEPTKVRVEGDYSFVAQILAPQFAGQDEADRQEAVYHFLRERFSEDDMQAIEFIFTNAPGDAA